MGKTSIVLIHGGFCLGKTLVSKVINIMVKNTKMILENKIELNKIYKNYTNQIDKQTNIEKYFDNFFIEANKITKLSEYPIYLLDQSPCAVVAYRKLLEPLTNIKDRTAELYLRHKDLIDRSIIICFYSKDIDINTIYEHTVQRGSKIDVSMFNETIIKNRISDLNNYFKEIVDNIPSKNKYFICANLHILDKAKEIVDILTYKENSKITYN